MCEKSKSTTFSYYKISKVLMHFQHPLAPYSDVLRQRFLCNETSSRGRLIGQNRFWAISCNCTKQFCAISCYHTKQVLCNKTSLSAYWHISIVKSALAIEYHIWIHNQSNRWPIHLDQWDSHLVDNLADHRPHFGTPYKGLTITPPLDFYRSFKPLTCPLLSFSCRWWKDSGFACWRQRCLHIQCLHILHMCQSFYISSVPACRASSSTMFILK